MSDQTWAVLIGFMTVVGLRVLDWYLPENWHSKWVEKHGSKKDDDDE